ncbi:MAG: MBL fold metallo-hydrolase [Actinomycetota bacterium]|jgi:glyoxylase-like metal-dependent hydrolase (beta-lactamase superfamily II)|nr:MBL fold metallo-hydrolase [Actinomycetota bacterium]
MPYTGAVTVDGPADVLVLTHLQVTKAAVGPMDNNAYLLRCRDSGQQLLIDAAEDPERLLELIGDGGLTTVVTTHRHADHWQALPLVLQETGATCVAGRDDADHLPVDVDRALDDGDEVQVGNCGLRVVHLVGHTPGSVALVYDDPDGHPHAFTGDSLFPGGVGKTNTPTAFRQLVDDVEAKLFDKLPDATWVYPGHGDDTTLGAERPYVDEWRSRGW